ncbi:response regulator [Candidatus Bathyarchaeota archaeon]|nr:response regulator [Candidatus Bathyarchaeota archaeon]
MQEPTSDEKLDMILHMLQDHQSQLKSLSDKVEQMSEREHEEEDAKKNAGDKRILVVDDNRSLAETYQIILSQEGFTVDTAHDAVNTLYKLNKTKYDLVILDMNLPDMMGNDIAEKINREHKDVEIIMITGYSSYAEELQQNGLIRDYRMKPIPPEELVEITWKVFSE